MEHNAVLDAIIQRRSVRHFTSEQIPDEKLQASLIINILTIISLCLFRDERISVHCS